MEVPQMTIMLGQQGSKIKVLPWNNTNGMLIAGSSGSGKSTSAAHYLTQYAFLGAKIILADYGASVSTGQTLTDRIAHLKDAMLLPPVTEADDILRYMEYIRQEGQLRAEGKRENTPLIFVIDEFSAFMADTRPKKKSTRSKSTDEYGNQVIEEQAEATHLDKFFADVVKLRKNNVRFVLLGQDWAATGGTQGMAKLRSNINTWILHRLDNRLAGIFGFSTKEEKRMIMNLKPGQIYFNGDVFQVPLLEDGFTQQTADKIMLSRLLAAGV